MPYRTPAEREPEPDLPAAKPRSAPFSNTDYLYATVGLMQAVTAGIYFAQANYGGAVGHTLAAICWVGALCFFRKSRSPNA